MTNSKNTRKTRATVTVAERVTARKTSQRVRRAGIKAGSLGLELNPVR